MIDPNTMMGAFTGGQQPTTQVQNGDVAQTHSQQPVPQVVQPPVQPPAPVVQTPPALQVPQADLSGQAVDPVSANNTATNSLDLLESLIGGADTPPPPSPVAQSAPANQVPQAPQIQQVPTPVELPAQPQPVPGVPAQAVISNIQNTPDPLNPPNPAPASAKESFERPAAPDAASVDGSSGAVQAVEIEKNPELPVEVEGFLQRVEDFSAQEPQEVVIADGTSESANTNYSKRPVIVLPISKAIEKKGKRKSPQNSIRWLVEWSHKVIKMFAGKVIYREVEEK